MRQMGGGSVMVWGMLLPFGYVRVFRMIEKIDSKAYVNFLQENVLPVLEDLFESFDFVFQQDNASIHTGKVAMEWLLNNFPSVLDWPAKSPDVNPQENVWKLLSERVYDGPSYKNTEELWEGIKKAEEYININKRDVLKNLVDGMNSRLIKVIEKGGKNHQLSL